MPTLTTEPHLFVLDRLGEGGEMEMFSSSCQPVTQTAGLRGKGEVLSCGRRNELIRST